MKRNTNPSNQVNMKKLDKIDLLDKIKEAILLSAKKMVENKKKLGQKLVISENGIVKIVDPQ